MKHWLCGADTPWEGDVCDKCGLDKSSQKTTIVVLVGFLVLMCLGGTVFLGSSRPGAPEENSSSPLASPAAKNKLPDSSTLPPLRWPFSTPPVKSEPAGSGPEQPDWSGVAERLKTNKPAPGWEEFMKSHQPAFKK
jgi:hypothetical protein